MRMKRGRRFLRDVSLCSLIAVIASCSDGSEPVSDGCPQTYEFGNYGCARIRGAVRNAAGEPLAGARVSLAPPSDVPNFYDSPTADTDETGLYRLEIHNYGPPPSATSADTVAMYVRAFLPSTEAPIGDSVLVDMIFAPVGAMPEMVEMDITID
jgi:hypothetical protein